MTNFFKLEKSPQKGNVNMIDTVSDVIHDNFDHRNTDFAKTESPNIHDLNSDEILEICENEIRKLNLWYNTNSETLNLIYEDIKKLSEEIAESYKEFT